MPQQPARGSHGLASIAGYYRPAIHPHVLYPLCNGPDEHKNIIKRLSMLDVYYDVLQDQELCGCTTEVILEFKIF